MARAGQNTLLIASLLLLQVGVGLHLQGQDSTAKNALDAPGQNPIAAADSGPAERTQSIRVLTLPRIQPSLEEITLHILTAE